MAQVPATRSSMGGRLAPRRENPLQQLQRDFDTLFGRMMGGWVSPFDQDFEPMRIWDFDVTEDDKEITVRAEIPGFNENELDVQLSNNVLTIKAEKEEKGDGREERRSFYRRVVLPQGIDTEKVQASYQNGVLELHIPRAEEAQPKRIKVQAQQAASGQKGQQAASGQQKAQAGNGGQQSGSPAGKTAPEKAQK